MLGDPTFIFIEFMNGLSLGMNLYIMAAGLSLIFGVLRVLNFAHGAFFMLGGYVTFSLAIRLKTVPGGFWLAVLGAALALAAIALVIERLLLRHLYRRDHLYQLLFTFALILLAGDAVKLLWGTDVLSVSFPPGLDGATDLGISYYPSYRVFLSVVGMGVILALWLVIARTRWGRIVRAATQDREMLAALGLNVPLIFTVVFMIGSALAGLGGALAAPAISLYPGMDTDVIVQAFIIVIVGGLGSLWGTFVGALLLGELTAFGIVLVPDLEIVLVYLMMVVVLMVRPWGLFGRPEDV